MTWITHPPVQDKELQDMIEHLQNSHCEGLVNMIEAVPDAEGNLRNAEGEFQSDGDFDEAQDYLQFSETGTVQEELLCAEAAAIILARRCADMRLRARRLEHDIAIAREEEQG